MTTNPDTALNAAQVAGLATRLRNKAQRLDDTPGFNSAAGHVEREAADVLEILTKQLADARAELAQARKISRRLERAGQIVMRGLNARIDTAPSSAKPVFGGIADLHDALGLAKRVRSQR